MSNTIFDSPPNDWTVADLMARLPGISSERIHTFPAPGTATEEDLLAAMARTNRIYELIDGILVEKKMATLESILACLLIHLIHQYLDQNNLGTVTGEAGLLRLFPGQIRAPDVGFISWSRLAEQHALRPAIYRVAPNLAVEILSKSNTDEEMTRKLQDYFSAGTEMVWHVDPQSRTAKVFLSPEQWTDIDAGGTLTGGLVLPGFTLSLAELFARAAGPKT